MSCFGSKAEDAITSPDHFSSIRYSRETGHRNPYTLEQDKRILSIVEDNDNWRLVIEPENSPFQCKMVVETELMQECIEAAQRSVLAPVPVTVELNHWTSRPQQPFDEWVVHQLAMKYEVPIPTGWDFLQRKWLILLFFRNTVAK